MTPNSSPETTIRVGIDVYSLRSQSWNAFETLDYCRRLGAQVVHFSEPRFIGDLKQDHLLAVRAHAARLGLEIEIGMLSICPTSNLFNSSRGPADAQLAEMIHAAEIIGSPIVRAVMGNAADRRGPIPLQDHMENTIRVLRTVRSRAIDAGIKIAMENHSGDMQAWELKTLIEEAGSDFVGVCLDSGNPLITIEDPHVTLETLAPHVLTSHVRDSRVWLTQEGAAAAWVRMGEGNVGIHNFVTKYQQSCPQRTISLELILSNQPRLFPYRTLAFWDSYRRTPAWQFARFLSLAEKGTPPAFAPPVVTSDLAAQERADVEASFRCLQDVCSRTTRRTGSAE